MSNDYIVNYFDFSNLDSGPSFMSISLLFFQKSKQLKRPASGYCPTSGAWIVLEIPIWHWCLQCVFSKCYKVISSQLLVFLSYLGKTNQELDLQPPHHAHTYTHTYINSDQDQMLLISSLEKLRTRIFNHYLSNIIALFLSLEKLSIVRIGGGKLFS